jgi:hypothetical protein
MEEGQTIQLPLVKRHNEYQWSTQHYTEYILWETRIPPKTGIELGFSESVSNCCSISGTRRVTLVTNKSWKRKGRILITTNRRLVLKGLNYKRKSKKPMADNTMDKEKNDDLQNTTQKTEDWVMQTPLKPELNPEKVLTFAMAPVVLHL